MVRPIPEGFQTITAHITVADAAAAIDFYAKAFGAVERFRMPGADGEIMHAEVQIGSSVLMLHDEFPEYGAVGPAKLGGSPVKIHLYVEDVDAAFATAVEAGCEVSMPVQDMFWGDRYGALTDPFGHHWAIATHTEDLTPEQIAERAAASMSS